MKHLLTGLTIPHEYVCVSLDDMQQQLSVVATSRCAVIHLDVTATHVFLGYKPLLIALDSAMPDFIADEEICLNFMFESFEGNEHWREFQTDKNCVARLIVRRVKCFGEDNRFVLYEGVYGSHTFLSSFHQRVNSFRAQMKKQPEGNVSLEGNLYDQVRIAYSVARIIALITVGNGREINMFPTDLHGAMDGRNYVSSLRIGGKANEQVERNRKLVLSFIPANQFKAVYALGKNHMKEMQPVNAFKLNDVASPTFGIPLPTDTLYYYELTLKESFDMGIHRIHLYEKINECSLREGSTLAHIHQYYAQWRLNYGIENKFSYV